MGKQDKDVWFFVDKENCGRFFKRGEEGYVAEIVGNVVDELKLVVTNMPVCQPLDIGSKSISSCVEVCRKIFVF